jgi:transcriptional regulator with XRE-family HTH domain
MTVGERIRALRKSLGMTQEELAHKVGYKTKGSINKIETSRDIPIDKVKKVALALDVSPSVLMGWQEDARLYDGTKDALFLRLFHTLSERDQEIIIQTMRTMSKTDLL